MTERTPCYTCGRPVTAFDLGHNPLCPNHRRNRNRIDKMSEKTFSKLIPVGSWAFSPDGLALGEIAKRNHYTPRTEPFA